ncbi:MAG: chromosomal replication initiator DnaA [Rhodovibrionaceae bacterium]|nr:chromosomal replication initiator DnaA [Rhodovibrionaceae bacterium]
MSGGGQLALALLHRPAVGREDFLVGPANEAAVAWIDRWPRWPQPCLAIHGPARAGKSHLVSVWQEASGARILDLATLSERGPAELLDEARDFAIEDVDHAIATATEPARLEENLLHAYNLIREAGGHLLLTGRAPPARWRLQLADLRSRMLAVPVVALGAPDDPLMEGLLVKLLADRQLRVAPGVVHYLAARMERSFEAACALVDRLDRQALAERREITIPLARRVLEEIGPSAP